MSGGCDLYNTYNCTSFLSIQPLVRQLDHLCYKGDKDGNTPLHLAARLGNMQAVENGLLNSEIWDEGATSDVEEGGSDGGSECGSEGGGSEGGSEGGSGSEGKSGGEVEAKDGKGSGDEEEGGGGGGAETHQKRGGEEVDGVSGDESPGVSLKKNRVMCQLQVHVHEHVSVYLNSTQPAELPW